jgi:hypothetical protein
MARGRTNSCHEHGDELSISIKARDFLTGRETVCCLRRPVSWTSWVKFCIAFSRE